VQCSTKWREEKKENKKKDENNKPTKKGEEGVLSEILLSVSVPRR
jgi:hypothetical protein